jgi:MHS family metabolite:H+ symporter-like MFS transporter
VRTGLCSVPSCGLQTVALLPELFGNRHRYLGVAISREFSAVIAGGRAGVLGAILIKEFDGSWLGIYAFILAVITFATTFITPDTVGRDLTRITDAVDDDRPVEATPVRETVAAS